MQWNLAMGRVYAEMLSGLMALGGEAVVGKPEVKQKLTLLAKLPAEEALESAGYRIEGPGRDDQNDLAGKYWWTVSRPGWMGCESGESFDTAAEARGDAVRAMLVDEDIDWDAGEVKSHASHQFDAGFKTMLARMVQPAEPTEAMQ